MDGCKTRVGRRWAVGRDGPSHPTQGGTWGNTGPLWFLPRREHVAALRTALGEGGKVLGKSVEL